MSAKHYKPKRNVQKTRKQLRKEERKNKKIKRNEYYTNRKKPGQYVLLKKNDKSKTDVQSFAKEQNKKERNDFTKVR